MRPPWQRFAVAFCLALVTGCSADPAPESGPSGSPAATSSRPVPSTVPEHDDGVVRLLFLGNSHTARHDVPATVAALWRASEPAAEVVSVRSPASMLTNDRERHQPSLALVGSQAWDAVVIQGQNYSASGRFDYPTTGAELFVRLAREQGAIPVLFAEWPRRGLEETERIVATYARVSASEPSCLPPVPEAFDLADERYPRLVLHADDGNHASAAGAFLASVVLWASISGGDPEELPAIELVEVGPGVQGRLRSVAAVALRDVAARDVVGERRCPALDGH